MYFIWQPDQVWNVLRARGAAFQQGKRRVLRRFESLLLLVLLLLFGVF